MSTTFKPGDKVKCVSSKDAFPDVLKYGKIYTVERDSGTGDVQLEELSKHGYFYSWRFKLVKEMDTMLFDNKKHIFPVGSTVECIKPEKWHDYDNSTFTLGKTYTVLGHIADERYAECDVITNDDTGTRRTSSIRRFRLAGEIDALVATANAGFEALGKLQGLAKELVMIGKDGKEIPVEIGTLTSDYKLAKKKVFSFESFRLGSWDVSMPNKDVVMVGCQKFSHGALLKALRHVVKQNENFATLPCFGGVDEQLQAARQGIRWRGHNLSWDDAEKLYYALDAVNK